MALDEPQSNDKVFDEKGITFIVDNELFERAKPISIDFVQSAAGSGFSVTSELSKMADCCGTCAC